MLNDTPESKATANGAARLPTRASVAEKDTWDLASLFRSEEDWERALNQLSQFVKSYGRFHGQLGSSPKKLADCLTFDSKVDRLAERVGTYAFLRTSEDQSNSSAQRMLGRYQNVATRLGEAASYIRPEILAIPEAKMKKFLAAKELAHFALLLERLRRYRPYTLGEKEESLLAMQGEMAQAASRIFRQLLDADMTFGNVKDENGRIVELTHSTYMQLLHQGKRAVRRTAFHQYYQQFQGHANTLSAALSSSVQKDVYYAKARGYESSLAAALFPDNVPRSVYDNLIAAVREKLPALYRYYDLRRRKMRLKQLHHYDTYVPIVPGMKSRRTWAQASKTIISALQPLGSEYCGILEEGLSGRWCDRYPNRGKQSGAFSCGSFDGAPYILMNYKPEIIEDMFTLAHEAGHSMHSYHSARYQRFEYYNYTIFVAEVASTFNEELLSSHLLAHANDDKHRAFLVNREIDSIRGTIIRQTMFAEFERIIHEAVEKGEPLTVDSLKEIYRSLLQDYFGPDFALDDELALEGLRIPHFYRAFYVYKYATGLSAAIALSRRVLGGGQAELDDYLGFLKAGCSKYPLDILRDAGVDMRQRAPVQTALDYFEELVIELDGLL